MSESADQTSEVDLSACIEALLFVSPGSVTIQHLAAATGKSQAEVQAALNDLSARYEQGSGLRLQSHAGRVQLTTAPIYSSFIERFLGLDATSRLSRAALETLAILAYQQPITRPQVDAIRGVSSDGVLKSLLSKGLIQEAGRAEGPGRPILYGTTADFLQYFGLSSLSELPPLNLEIPKETTGQNGNVLKD